uniref:Radical SAM protein n=1 Tax=Ignisphaera aggregans TaxID=334771 RepID=A0A7C2Z8Z7_9CREN
MIGLDDILRIGEWVEKEVCLYENDVCLRRYYRFRSSRHYGGSAVGDVVGCNLSCLYCWCWRINSAHRGGTLLSPEEVVTELLSIARHNGYRVLRLSGGEPTLCFDHTVQVLEALKHLRHRKEVFVLETNGIVLGLRRDLVSMLRPYSSFLVVRVSLKGCSEGDFSRITGIEGSLFRYQIKAVENIISSGISCRVAIPVSLCSRESAAELMEELSNKIGGRFIDFLEPEVLVLYPSVVRRMCGKGLKPWMAFDPVSKKIAKGEEVVELFKRVCSQQD